MILYTGKEPFPVFVFVKVLPNTDRSAIVYP